MRRLAVFARAPVSGRVKTRLSPALPAPLAAALYSGLLADTFDALLACPADERQAYWSDEHSSLPDGIVARSQRGADLGERLRHAFDAMLPVTNDRALVVGSDTPALTASHLSDAFAALESHDAVLGPTSDGGYWCIGLSRPAGVLFKAIPWSTPAVFARTLEIAQASGLRVARAATLDDIDTPHDLAKLIGRLAASGHACGGNARQALRAMGLAPGPGG